METHVYDSTAFLHHQTHLFSRNKYVRLKVTYYMGLLNMCAWK